MSVLFEVFAGWVRACVGLAILYGCLVGVTSFHDRGCHLESLLADNQTAYYQACAWVQP